jgi:chaperonin GroES
MKILSVNVGRALVRPQKKEEKTAGGIFIPGSIEAALITGEILLAGPPRVVNGDETSISMKPGFKVLFDPMGATKVKSETNEDLLVIRQEDVIAIVTE